jgi:hypothetical protein
VGERLSVHDELALPFAPGLEQHRIVIGLWRHPSRSGLDVLGDPHLAERGVDVGARRG